jgi:hypothetical protein
MSRRAVRTLLRDFTIIFTTWAISAYPILLAAQRGAAYLAEVTQ